MLDLFIPKDLYVSSVIMENFCLKSLLSFIARKFCKFSGCPSHRILFENLLFDSKLPVNNAGKSVSKKSVKTMLRRILSSDLIFEAEVVKISESANLIEGVPVYEVLLQITSDTNLVKSGMTANIDILTDKRENVLFIPSRAVTDSKVKILLENGMIEQRDIKTGLKSFDAKIEVTSGLEEGEKVITYMEEENE